jgi:hypothetical protein
MRGTNETDLCEREPERLSKERQEHVRDVRKPVVERMRSAAGGERAPAFFAYNRGVHIVVYIVAALFIVLTLGLLFAYIRERHPGTLLMAVAYGTSAGVALALVKWWPLLAGFIIAWAVKIMGLDPPPRNDPET